MRNSPRSRSHMVQRHGGGRVQVNTYASDALLDPLKDLMPMGLKSVWQASAPVSIEEI